MKILPTGAAGFIGMHVAQLLLARGDEVLGRRAVMQFKPMQPGDVEATYADTEALRRDVGFEPRTPLAEGLARWAGWYRSYENSRA